MPPEQLGELLGRALPQARLIDRPVGPASFRTEDGLVLDGEARGWSERMPELRVARLAGSDIRSMPGWEAARGFSLS